jgi:hypothetical protein
MDLLAATVSSRSRTEYERADDRMRRLILD